MVGFCSGAIAGLVAITPASGFVPPWSAVIFGVVGAVSCNYATKLKYLLGVDDALDVFGEHGVGGIVGNLLTALFAAYVALSYSARSICCFSPGIDELASYQSAPKLNSHLTQNRDYIAHLDGFTEIPGGWLNRHWVQLGYQLADCVTGFGYSFVGTCIILFLMNLVPGLSLRATAEEEAMGIDEGQLGEYAYDYVELRREFSDVIVGEESDARSGRSVEAIKEVPIEKV